MKDSIKALRELEKRLYAYQYAMAVADYDSETVAPPESSAGRAEAMEVLSRAYFDQLVSADTAALLQRAAADAETEQERQKCGSCSAAMTRLARSRQKSTPRSPS